MYAGLHDGNIFQADPSCPDVEEKVRTSAGFRDGELESERACMNASSITFGDS